MKNREVLQNKIAEHKSRYRAKIKSDNQKQELILKQKKIKKVSDFEEKVRNTTSSFTTNQLKYPSFSKVENRLPKSPVKSTVIKK